MSWNDSFALEKGHFVRGNRKKTIISSKIAYIFGSLEMTQKLRLKFPPFWHFANHLSGDLAVLKS